jgi:hypothetical protein
VRAELRQALGELLPAQAEPSAPPRQEPPAPPPGLPPLHDHPLDLWADIYATPRPIELRQLAALASEHDAATGGHGAYWTSRAILAAALVNEQPGIKLIKTILDRWRTGDCYGSDAPTYERRNGHHPPPPDAPPPDAPADDSATHPAVQQYCERTGAHLSARQAAHIAATVSDLDAWRQTLDTWLLNGWRVGNIANMLDAYAKHAAPAAPAAERVSSLEIDLAPIDPTDRGLWSGRFREAATAAEKRQVLERFRAWLSEQGESDGTTHPGQH